MKGLWISMCKSINNTKKEKKKVLKDHVLVGQTGSLVKYGFQINGKKYFGISMPYEICGTYIYTKTFFVIFPFGWLQVGTRCDCKWAQGIFLGWWVCSKIGFWWFYNCKFTKNHWSLHLKMGELYGMQLTLKKKKKAVRKCPCFILDDSRLTCFFILWLAPYFLWHHCDEQMEW